MRIRPYIEDKDFEYLAKWIDDEKIHALWCANLMPYPITKENLHSFLEKNAVITETETVPETEGVFEPEVLFNTESVPDAETLLDTETL